MKTFIEWRNRYLNKPFRSSRYRLVSGAKSFVCSVSLTNLALWFEAQLTIWYHMFMFFSLLDLCLIIKAKVIVWKLGCKKIFHIKLYDQTLTQNIRFDREGWNKISLDKLLFGPKFLLVLINQKSGDENNINTWLETRNQLYRLSHCRHTVLPHL